MRFAASAERTRAETGHELRSLRTELLFWNEQAASPALEKHQRQIDSLVRILQASLDQLSARQAANIPERVLDLHHVWDFFRAKFALRYVQPIKGFLESADELAWSVYLPAFQAAFPKLDPVPPLVFLNREASPFALASGSGYHDLLPRNVRTEVGAEIARTLPFPIIGVPWYMTGHAPGLVLVAHETGHHIENDCGLSGALLKQLETSASLGERRAKIWRAWLGEVFADVVASVACGEAYLSVLVDLLAAAPAGGAGSDSYPPPRVRGHVCLEAIRAVGLSVDDELADACDRLGEPTDADGEAQQVVCALLTASYADLGEKNLVTVLLSGSIADADTAATKLLAGTVSGQLDARAIIAAAALAFARDPDGYDSRSVGDRVIRETLAVRPACPRAAIDLRAEKARDKTAGLRLLELLADSDG